MSKRTLVLGASLNPNRYAYKAIQRLRSQGVDVVAFGLRAGVVGDVAIDTVLKKYEDIHTITLYLNPKNQQDFYQYMITLKPKRVLFNPGTENPELMQLLQKNGIKIEVACTLVLLSLNQY